MNQPTHLLDRLKLLYQKMDAHTIDHTELAAVYTHDLHFEDSLHTIKGLGNFETYCKTLYKNLSEVSFTFHDTFLAQNDQAMLNWTLTYKHRHLNRGREIKVPGASHLRFNEKIYFHKDYFDAGRLLYEQIPLLGSMIKFIKRQSAT